MTWTQLGLHRKRCGLLNVAGFYDPLLALFDRAVADGFLNPQNRTIVAADADPAALLDRLGVPADPPEPKWMSSIDPGNTNTAAVSMLRTQVEEQKKLIRRLIEG